MKLLLAPNTYKETADSIAAASLFTKYLKYDKLEIIGKPISDGGDAFLKITKGIYKLKNIYYDITTSYNDEIMQIEAGYNENNSTLYIESAEVLGLKVIPKAYRNPGVINSKGLGDLLRQIEKDVENKKLTVKRVLIGIGGTGTNDLALGACSRFGLKLFDEEKEMEVKPLNYHKVKRIEWEKKKLPFEMILIVDVKNKLLGKNGATLTFGRQKGADDYQLQIIEKGFKNIAGILYRMNMIDSVENLSGAGGGLAAGLSIFFNAKLKPAKEFILKDLSISKIKNDIDYVVTGEGYFDAQSLMEKGTGIIIDEFKDSAKKIFLVCGRIDQKVKEKLNGNVYCIELQKYFSSKEESINNFENGIELACKEIKNCLNM